MNVFIFFSGVTADPVLRVPTKSQVQIKKKMSVTDINKRKLRSLLGNKELVHEILKEKSKNLSEQKIHVARRGKKRKRSDDLACGTLKKPKETTLNGRRILRSGICTSPKVVKKRGRRSWGGPRSLARLIQTSMQSSEVTEIAQVDEPTERPTRTTRTHGEMDEYVSVVKEKKIWKVTLCNEKKQNVLTVEVCTLLMSLFC